MAGRLIGRWLVVTMLTLALPLIGPAKPPPEGIAMPSHDSHFDLISPQLRPLAVPLAELRPDPGNARRHGKRNLSEISRSLRVHGQQKPVVVDADGVILAGNGTFHAAEQLGWTHLAAVRSTLRGAAAQAYAIADNRTSDLSEWDDEALARTLAALRADDLIDATSTGYSDLEIDLMLAELAAAEAPASADAAPPLPEPDAVRTARGDLWELGRHRLLVGDSTRAEDLGRLLGDSRVGLVFTDPPYNMNYRSAALGGIANDHLDRGAFTRLILGSMNQMKSALRDGGSYYVCMGPGEYAGLAQQLVRLGLKHQLLVWAKPSPGMGSQEFRPQYELMLYGYTGTRAQRTWNGARRSSNLWALDVDSPVFARESEVGGMVIEVDRGRDTVELFLDQRSDGEIVFDDGTTADVWSFGRERGGYTHPTQKPVELVRRAIHLSSEQGDTVLDLFTGSGTTLVAAERTGRVFRGLELDTRYADVICQRWIDLGGDTPKRHDGALFTDLEPVNGRATT